MGKVILTALFFASALGAIEWMSRTGKVTGELARKLAHVVAGTASAFLPEVISFASIMILGLVSAPALALSRRHNILGSIHGVGRRTLGEVYFPLGIVASAALFPHSRLFAYGVLVMAVADGSAALAGRRFAKRHYRIGPGEKSYLGSTVFFLLTCGIGLAVAPGLPVEWVGGIAAILVLTEARLWGGLDNLVLPPLGAALLALATAAQPLAVAAGRI